MANRPIFLSKNEYPYYACEDTEFQFYSGFSPYQKQKSIRSLHEAFLNRRPEKKIIEISSKSEIKIGYELSAFNLLLNTTKGPRNIENVFQAGKEFELGGPFEDLLDKLPVEAKRDERLHNSGNLVAFHFEGQRFALDPKDYFYNWIYSKALYESKDKYEAIFDYDAFTDIEFNPKKSINCQARTVAIFVGLHSANLLDEAMKNKEAYLEIVYNQKNQIEYSQVNMFDFLK